MSDLPEPRPHVKSARRHCPTTCQLPRVSFHIQLIRTSVPYPIAHDHDRFAIRCVLLSPSRTHCKLPVSHFPSLPLEFRTRTINYTPTACPIQTDVKTHSASSPAVSSPNPAPSTVSPQQSPLRPHNVARPPLSPHTHHLTPLNVTNLLPLTHKQRIVHCFCNVVPKHAPKRVCRN